MLTLYKTICKSYTHFFDAQAVHTLKIVRKRLGHASIQITIETYCHIMPGLQEAAALAFDKGLTREPVKVAV